VNRRAKAYLAGLAALATILVAVGTFSWWFLDGSTTRPRILRSRLTLVVETPEGERSGSSVTQNSISFPGGLAKAQGYSIWPTLIGEGVVVDLGSRGLLFATFESKSGLARGGMDMYNAAFAPFPREKFRSETRIDSSATDELAAYVDELNRHKPKGALPFKDLPVLVRFRDPSDPTSVEIVDPLNLAASFGPGVMLKSAFVEITDDPVTKGIEAKLPWLASSKVSPSLFPRPDPKLGPRTVSETPPAEDLQYNDFRRLPQ
jgi:hypothetical protein